jgi:Ca2+-binding RTX toxin-like protein
MARIDGTNDPDSLIGTAEDDRISCYNGDDTAFGGDGDDKIDGHGGADRLFGEGGNDTLSGSGGRDTFDGGEGDDVIEISGGRALVLGGAGNDRLYDYPLTKDADKLVGGIGDDTIQAGGGADSIIGGTGADLLSGGGSKDKFIYQRLSDSTIWHRDTIGDWQNGLDVLDLRRLDADQTAVGDQAFTFVGTAAFTGAAGELRYEHVDGNTIISAQVDADTEIDFQIRISGVHDLGTAVIWL